MLRIDDVCPDFLEELLVLGGPNVWVLGVEVLGASLHIRRSPYLGMSGTSPLDTGPSASVSCPEEPPVSIRRVPVSVSDGMGVFCKRSSDTGPIFEDTVGATIHLMPYAVEASVSSVKRCKTAEFHAASGALVDGPG